MVALQNNADDDSASKRKLDPGVATASKGTTDAHVELKLDVGEQLQPLPPQPWGYRVRARTSDEPASASEPVDGWRGVGEISVLRQRSLADNDGNFSDIPVATTLEYFDDGAPVEGFPRYYRAVLSADGADWEVTDGVRGYRSYFACADPCEMDTASRSAKNADRPTGPLNPAPAAAPPITTPSGCVLEESGFIADSH